MLDCFEGFIWNFAAISLQEIRYFESFNLINFLFNTSHFYHNIYFQWKLFKHVSSYFIGYQSIIQYLEFKTVMIYQIIQTDNVPSPSITLILDNPWKNSEDEVNTYYLWLAIRI